MKIRVLAYATSPRRNGNSETVLDWMLDAMRVDPDTVITKVVVPQVDIRPCKGCNACEKTGECVIDDAMQPLYEETIASDIILIAAPVYCMGLCAQAKVLIDRGQMFRSRKYVLKLPIVPEDRVGKRMACYIGTAGQDWDYVFDASLAAIDCYFHLIGIRKKDVKNLLIRSVDEKGAVYHHPTAQEEALLLASSLICEIRDRNQIKV
ncbi:MAG: flavodoxin family protein [Methanomicrobiales archaeon]|nr:flavodoxin family protein [Methanomicrobiales archaeon]